MRGHLRLLLCACSLASVRAGTQTCFDVAPVRPTAVGLCGNGVLDAGEVCDDGNAVGGDGCNAWFAAVYQKATSPSLSVPSAPSFANGASRLGFLLLCVTSAPP